MHKIVFTEEFCQPATLFPFTLTRQVQDIRVGILTIREKWERQLGLMSFDKVENDYRPTDRAFVIDDKTREGLVYLVAANVLPTENIVQHVKKLLPGEFLSVPELKCVVHCVSEQQMVAAADIKMGNPVEINEPIKKISLPWHIFQLNAWATKEDFTLLTKGRASAAISPTNYCSNPADIFFEEGATAEFCFLNAQSGPVYIGKGAKLMEGAMLRGPVAIGDGAVVKMGAKIYEGTTIGPNCIAGGEIKNSVLFGNSNKAHDGYMGDSVIGEWCNWGAGTSNSNIKNTASDVLVWLPSGAASAGTKCGVMMGDFSRTAINTSINTGTVIGACANVFGQGLSPKYIPSFSWGATGLERYRLDKAYADINNWKLLKGSAITTYEKHTLKHIFDHY